MGKVEDRIQYWMKAADYDLNTAAVLLEGERFLHVAFVCQQAIEKTLKAIYLKFRDEEAPYSHNLSFLARQVSLDLDETRFTLFEKLTAFYIRSRYPFYDEDPSEMIDQAEAETLLNRTREVLLWLKSRLS